MSNKNAQFSIFSNWHRIASAVALLLIVATPSANAQSVTITFTNYPGANLANYYIYFTAPPTAVAGYTLTNGVTGTFTTAPTPNPSILTTNQISLASLTSVSLTNTAGGRFYISYGQFGPGITYTNSSLPTFSGPSRFSGAPGSTNPFQFFEGNSTLGVGNFDTTYIDAYSFPYTVTNVTAKNTGYLFGLSNSASYMLSQFNDMVTTNSAYIPVGGTNPYYASVLGNGSLLTPSQFPPLTNYLTQLAVSTATNPINIGWTSNDAVATPGRAAISKQYGINYTTNWVSYSVTNSVTNSVTFNTMAVFASFSGTVVTNSSQLGNYGFTLTNGNTGLLLTNGMFTQAFWGGTNAGPFTATNPYIVTNSLWNNAALLAQGTATNTLNTLMRTAPNTGGGYQYSSNYSNFTNSMYTVAGAAPAGEQSVLYIDDFYAAIMMGLAGSTVTNTASGDTSAVNTYNSAWWWGWTNPVAYGTAQPNNSNNYDPYSGLIYNLSEGRTYGYAFSDRFIGANPGVLIQYTSTDTLLIAVGLPMLTNTVPIPPGPPTPPTPGTGEFMWSNVIGGDWSVASNWTNNTVPTGSNTATIDGGYSVISTPGQIDTIYIGSSNGASGGLVISNSLTASNVYVGLTGGAGWLTNAGALNVSSNLFVGVNASNGQIGIGTLVNQGSGSITSTNLSVGFWGGYGYLSNAGSITAQNLSVGYGNSGTGTLVNASGSTLSASNLSVGYGGTGILTNLGMMSAYDLTIGYGSPAFAEGFGSGTGTLTLGTDSIYYVTNILSIAIGRGSTGSLNIGTYGGGDSNITVGIGSLVFGSGNCIINFNQTDGFILTNNIAGGGSLNQFGSGTTVLTGSNSFTGSTTITNGVLRLGNRNALQESTVNLTVANGLRFDTNIGTFNIGGLSGSGSISLQDSSSTAITLNVGGNNADTIYSGSLGGAGKLVKVGTGALILTGHSRYSETWANGGALVISNGVVSNTVSYIGHSANSSGTVLATGSNSRWTNSDRLYVGYSGSGNSLVISSGGTVASSNGIIGSQAGSSNNSVQVTGNNSTWTNSDHLYVGDAGSGNSLTIADGGSVAASSIMIASQTGSSGELNIGRFGTNDTAGTIIAPTITFGAGTGAINFNQRDATTITSAISGTGTINQLGAGTTILSGNDTYTGATLVSGGTLVASSTNALGSSTVTLSGGTLALQTNLNISSLIWDSAAIIALPRAGSTNYLTVSGAASLTGSGTNTFDLTGVTLSTNPVELFNFGTNGLTTNQFSLTGVRYYELAVINNALWASNPALICATNQTTVVSNTITFPFVIFDPNSTLGITPAGNLTITSAMTVSNNSMVILNGVLTTPSLTVDQGSTIMGSGTLSLTGGNLTVNGTFAPGNSPGTFFVSGGNLVMGASAVWDQQIYSASVYDRVVVTGSAILNGTMNITTGGVTQLQFGQKYNFLTASGGISGAFSSIIAPEGFRGRLLLSGDNTQANILIAPASYTQLAANRNQSNVATALNSFIPYTSGDQMVVSTSLDSLTASQYNQAFNAIMPTFYQQIATIAFNNANAQNMQLVQRLWGLRVAEGGGFSMSGLADNMPILEGQGDGKGVQDSKKDILRPGLDNHWGMFVDGNGIFAQANSGNMLPGYNSQSGGVTTGLTYKWNENVGTGIYCGYQGTYTKSGADGSGLGTGSRLIDNAVRFGVFGTYGQKDGKGLFVNALAGGGYHNFQATRVIQYAGMNRTANSAPGAGELDTMLAAGYDIKKGKFTFGPTASLQYTYLGVNSLNETGAQSLSFNSGGWNSSSMLSSVGAHAAYSWVAGKNILVVPQVNLSWQHEFMQNPYAINGNLGGTSPTFSNWSTTPIRDFLYTGVGFTVEFAKRWNTSFFYNAAAGNNNLQSQNFFWSAGVKF